MSGAPGRSRRPRRIAAYYARHAARASVQEALPPSFPGRG
jgi:hypothetical protein